MKKVFFLSSAFLVVVLGFWAVYYFGFHDDTTNPIADPKQKEIAKKAESEITVNLEGRLTTVINEPVVGAQGNSGALYFYSSRDRSFKRTDLDGQNPISLLSEVSGTPKRVVWSPRYDGALVLLEVSGQGEWWHYLSLAEKRLIPLKREISRLTWTNLGDSILYQFTDPVTRKASLDLSLPDGSNWKKLTDLGEASYFFSPVPQTSLVSFWKRPNGLEQNTLEVITLAGDGRKTIFANRFGADFLWSKNGERLLVGSTTEKGRFEPALGLANENGGEYRDLGVPTLINKAVWSGDDRTIFYALPSPFPKETVLPNDYYAGSTTKDTFWKMDVLTGKRERLVPLDEMRETIDATDLFLSTDETSLFFTDRLSGKLYRINL